MNKNKFRNGGIVEGPDNKGRIILDDGYYKIHIDTQDIIQDISNKIELFGKNKLLEKDTGASHIPNDFTKSVKKFISSDSSIISKNRKEYLLNNLFSKI